MARNLDAKCRQCRREGEKLFLKGEKCYTDRCAIERRESRGGHFREDHPDKDPAFATFNLVVHKGADGEMQLDREPIPPLPAELAAIVEEMKG